ncbi:MAG: hypothetical protein U0V56_03190 [Actinomycetota bacterium]
MNAEAGPTPSDAELSAICDEAHRHDLPVTAHAQEGRARPRGRRRRLAHAPWTERLSDGAREAAAARMRFVSTLRIHGSGPPLETAATTCAGSGRQGGDLSYGTDLGNAGTPAGIDAREAQLWTQAGWTNQEVLAAMIRAPLDGMRRPT